MSVIDNAKETLKTVGEKARHEFEQVKDRLGDKADEVHAENKVKQAEAERKTVHQKNDLKEEIRD